MSRIGWVSRLFDEQHDMNSMFIGVDRGHLQLLLTGFSVLRSLRYPVLFIMDNSE